MSIRAALAACSILLAASSTSAADAFRFRSPFDPSQCQRAITAGSGWLLRESPSRARLVLAEGYLCRALQDDPWALRAAIRLFRDAMRDDPLDFFALLQYADALRRLYPISDEARAVLRRAQQMLADDADVGASRTELEAYVDEALRAMHSQRAAILPGLERRRRDLQAAVAEAQAASLGLAGSRLCHVASPSSPDVPDGGALDVSDLDAFLSQVVLRGPAGRREALDVLDAIGAALLTNPAELILRRVEILRGEENPHMVAELYRSVEAFTCFDDPLPESCRRARWRLQQLQSWPPYVDPVTR
jgi:tetratricopeptide (TPR) repeat protein